MTVKSAKKTPVGRVLTTTSPEMSNSPLSFRLALADLDDTPPMGSVNETRFVIGTGRASPVEAPRGALNNLVESRSKQYHLFALPVLGWVKIIRARAYPHAGPVLDSDGLK